MSRSLRELYESSPFSSAQAPFLEAQYERWLRNPADVEPEWRSFFDALGGGRPASVPSAPRRRTPPSSGQAPAAGEKQAAVSRLVQFYANRGHLIADIDPLGMMQRPVPRVLDPAYVGLGDADMNTEFHTGSRTAGVEKQMTLREILRQLRHIYTGRIGAEFAHVSTSDERLWLQDLFQDGRLLHQFSRDERLNLLWQLTAVEGLERYLHTRYVGQKRFSLEGGDALIPLLDDVVQRCGASGVEEIVIGMAHRGRLNVLVNLLGKAPSMLFSEFEGQQDLDDLTGSGDVKYHKGFSADLRTTGGNVHVVLAFNPSHLEVVNAVVEGSVRARQEQRGDVSGATVVPVLIHGDAAFAGQGVVMETLQLSQARGFSTGGTLHIVVNNQIGFTTSEPQDARSTLYCSDVAKMIEAPIFHVNADDPEAVVFVSRLALEYRMKFRKDVVIDLVCYRRHGHNEADEPAATQPLMYQAIRKHPTARQIYGELLEQDGLLDEGEAARMIEDYRRGLDEGRPQARAFAGTSGNRHTIDWSRYLAGDWSEKPDTAVAGKKLASLGRELTALPDKFTLHPRVARIVDDRRRMYAGELPLDWGAAETLGYATLLTDGFDVRFTGQDSARGTFFHRHAVLHDQASGRTFVPLERIAEGRARFRIIDSTLSEEAVLGFEYGYSTTDPGTLVIWEGQFGDFVNGAQVIIDQFISSGEAKWGRVSGITLFLPHGYEGQGPEHSSARLERFLQLSAELNGQVCVPSTPAQMFHMLRRQMLRDLRKPLVIMTPKSLLRHKRSTSTMSELSSGEFRTVIDDPASPRPADVRRIVLCSGKVYYDLLERRDADAVRDVALVRIEQLYPFPADPVFPRFKAEYNFSG
jgi:2-oxoglutarate dehydrogenase E1 component